MTRNDPKMAKLKGCIFYIESEYMSVPNLRRPLLAPGLLGLKLCYIGG